MPTLPRAARLTITPTLPLPTGADGLRVLGDLQRLVVRSGDVLVVTCPFHLSREQSTRVEASVHRVFPRHQVLVLGAGLQIGVRYAAPEEPASVVTSSPS